MLSLEYGLALSLQLWLVLWLLEERQLLGPSLEWSRSWHLHQEQDPWHHTVAWPRSCQQPVPLLEEVRSCWSASGAGTCSPPEATRVASDQLSVEVDIQPREEHMLALVGRKPLAAHTLPVQVQHKLVLRMFVGTLLLQAQHKLVLHTFVGTSPLAVRPPPLEAQHKLVLNTFGMLLVLRMWLLVPRMWLLVLNTVQLVEQRLHMQVQHTSVHHTPEQLRCMRVLRMFVQHTLAQHTSAQHTSAVQVLAQHTSGLDTPGCKSLLASSPLVGSTPLALPALLLDMRHQCKQTLQNQLAAGVDGARKNDAHRYLS